MWKGRPKQGVCPAPSAHPFFLLFCLSLGACVGWGMSRLLVLLRDKRGHTGKSSKGLGAGRPGFWAPHCPSLGREPGAVPPLFGGQFPPL